MTTEKKTAGYWFLGEQTYRFWSAFHFDADTPEEGRRRGVSSGLATVGMAGGDRNADSRGGNRE